MRVALHLLDGLTTKFLKHDIVPLVQRFLSRDMAYLILALDCRIIVVLISLWHVESLLDAVDVQHYDGTEGEICCELFIQSLLERARRNLALPRKRGTSGPPAQVRPQLLRYS